MTEVMDIGPVMIWAAAIMTLLNLGTTVWTILTGPARKLGKTVSDLDTRLDRHAQQLIGLSQTVNAMPGKDQMHQLELALAGIRGDLREIGATMEGNAKIMARLESVVTRHEDHLLDGGKR